MNYDFAPMEGLTDSVYRRLHHNHFQGIDRYYMPFLSPTMHQVLTRKEDRELPTADSVGFNAVPQILTKIPEDFLWAAEKCQQRGYSEVNLNIGCPSGTVVAKGKVPECWLILRGWTGFWMRSLPQRPCRCPSKQESACSITMNSSG